MSLNEDANNLSTNSLLDSNNENEIPSETRQPSTEKNVERDENVEDESSTSEISYETYAVYSSDSEPQDFLVLSTINTMFSLLIGSSAFFFAVAAFFFSLKTLEFNSDENLLSAKQASNLASCLNLVTMIIIITGFLASQLAWYSWDAWTWSNLYVL